MNYKKTTILSIGLLTVLLISGCALFTKKEKTDTTYNENLKKEFYQDDLNSIKITSPAKGEILKSPIIVKGEARGTWFFEGSFPVFLTDWDGLIIAEGNAKAQSDWMTDDFVEFEVELAFETPGLYKNGSLIFKKANPSDLSENDYAFEIPINFEKTYTELPKDKKTCLEKGGEWRVIGVSPRESCNMPTRDAGRICKNSSECEGSCIAELTDEEYKKVKKNQTIKKDGKCSEWIVIVGCRGFVVDGKVETLTCID